MEKFYVRPFIVGVNETDQGIMTYQRGYGTRIFLPIYVFYIGGGDRHIIVDSGLEDFITPAGFEEQTGHRVYGFEEALAEVGITPADVDMIIQTHLHNDHCENTYQCENARVLVQRAEWEFAHHPHPIDHRYFPDLFEGWNVELIEGDHIIEPGLEVLFTPGHTPGGQSVAVATSAGRVVITGFCANDRNFPANGPVVAPGVHLDAIQAWESARRVREVADVLLPCHELSIAGHRRIPE